MTEPRPAYDVATLTESELQNVVVKRMRGAGWLVIVTSQDRRTRKQVVGLTDLICIRWSEVVFMEVKLPGERLRDSQVKFAAMLHPHLGTCLHYQVVYWPDDVERWL